MRIILLSVGLVVALWRCQPDPHSPKGSFTADTTLAYTYEVDTQHIPLSLTLSSDLTASMTDLPRSFAYRNQLPDDWEAQFYSQFLALERDEAAIGSLLAAFRRMADTLPTSTLLDHAVAFVQSGIAYTDTTAYNVQEGLKYPYETLWLGHGVCSDKSVLLAKILLALDYDIAFMVFPTINHMGLGVRVPAAHGDFGTAYAYIETTMIAPIGYIPADLRRRLGQDVPHILQPLRNGSRAFEGMPTYEQRLRAWQQVWGEAYLTASATQRRWIQEIEALRVQVVQLQDQLEELGCAGVVPADRYATCAALIEQQRPIVQQYNALVERYNAAQ